MVVALLSPFHATTFQLLFKAHETGTLATLPRYLKETVCDGYKKYKCLNPKLESNINKNKKTPKFFFGIRLTEVFPAFCCSSSSVTLGGNLTLIVVHFPVF